MRHCFIVLLVAGATGGFLVGRGKKNASPAVPSTTSAPDNGAESTDSRVASAPTGAFFIDKIQRSMVQIRTQGTYCEFAQKATTSPGAGSGFLISADRLAVTIVAKDENDLFALDRSITTFGAQ